MSTLPIARLLRSTVLPWVTSSRSTAIVVARPQMRAADLPDGVTMTRRKIAGHRVVVKNKRNYNNRRNYVAVWPEDNLEETAFPELACIVNGIADYLLGDCCVHCNPGTFILMPPHVPHQCDAPNLQGERRRNGSCVLLHALAYQGGVHFWYSRSEGERHINEAIDNYLIPSVNAAHILHAMTDEAAEGKPHFEPVAAGFIAAFFAIIAREIEAGNYVHPGPKESTADAAQLTEDFSGQVRGYIETHCNKSLRLDGMAAHLYMSRSQFARRMQQEMGMTFGELLTQIRIERACKMLCETDYTVTAITNSLGLRSQTHFQTLFSSRVGCTPIEYRRKNASQN